MKEDFNYDDIIHKIIYHNIDEFEEWVNKTIEKIDKLEDGISEKEMYDIKGKFMKQWSYTYCCTFANMPRFMVDEGEKLRLERLKSDFEIALALARNKHKSKNKEKILGTISKIKIKVNEIILVKLSNK